MKQLKISNLLSIILVLTSLQFIQGNVYADVGVGTPAGTPLAVGSLTVTNLSSGSSIVSSMKVEWVPPTFDGGSSLLGYTATALLSSGSGGGVTSCTVPATTLTCNLSGLAYKTAYKVQALATNANGSSPIAESATFTTPALSQSVSITGDPGAISYGNADFQLFTTANSGLVPVWTSPTSTPTICSITAASGVVHILAAGTCTLEAIQSGVGSSYNSASATLSVPISVNLSSTLNPANNIQGTSAKLNATVPFPGANTTPTFCINALTPTFSTCTTLTGTTPAQVTSTSSNTVDLTATGLTKSTLYYYWITVTAGSSYTSPTPTSFTTLSGPTVLYTGSTAGVVGTAMSGTLTASDGSGTYSTWSAVGLPTGLSQVSAETTAAISGTPTTAGNFSAAFTVTDNADISSSITVNFTITTGSTGDGGGGGGGGAPLVTPVVPVAPVIVAIVPQSQSISIGEIPEPNQYGDPELSLRAITTSDLPLTYSVGAEGVCTISTTGIVAFLAAGQCVITISQAGNSSYLPATKTINIAVSPKMRVTLEEFANVQSQKASAFATAPWPGLSAEVKFCLSLINSKSECTPIPGVSFSDPVPSTITENSSNVVTSEITGLNPGTDYFVWAVETVGSQEATSAIRKLHTPVGPTIKYTGKTTYENGIPLKIVFRASGGAGGYKNWKTVGFPSGTKLAASVSTLTVSGENLQSGTYITSISVTDKKGSNSSITLPIIINGEVLSGQPASVKGATTQLITSKSVQVAWNKQEDAQKYEVTLANKVVCATAESTCVIKQLLGPKAQIAVTAISEQGIKSQPAPTIYKAPSAPIDIEVANFALNSPVLVARDKTKIAALAKTIQLQGFTSIQVAGHTDSQGNDALNSALSRARAVSTFKYLKLILAKTPISVTLLAEGSKSPVKTNATTEGRAANRRSVLSLN